MDQDNEIHPEGQTGMSAGPEAAAAAPAAEPVQTPVPAVVPTESFNPRIIEE